MSTAARRVFATVASRVGTAECTRYNAQSAANSRAHGKCLFGAVQRARPTFHTSVPINNTYTLMLKHEDGVWAHLDTHAAPVALFEIEFKCRNVKEIQEHTIRAFPCGTVFLEFLGGRAWTGHSSYK